MRVPKTAQVKNKAPAPIQTTAEQLLREANERRLESLPPPPRQKIADVAELRDFQLRKRKEYEDNIRRNSHVVSNWIKYAAWEESQQELKRARSIYERALDVDPRNITYWMRYAEMEMRNRQIDHARNLYDRAVLILPRANQLWYKYVYMEETLGNYAGARQLFEKWMKWHPHEQAWQTYINFELRYNEVKRARDIFERFVVIHPDVKNWIKFARFEEKHHFIDSARSGYERAVEFFGSDAEATGSSTGFPEDEELYIAFAKFEERQHEYERARAIYGYARQHLEKSKLTDVEKNFTLFEKKHGSKSNIEQRVHDKRKAQYKQEIVANQYNYDAWFDLINLLESEHADNSVGMLEEVRETYERAIACVPPVEEKRYWSRYIYLWIKYAFFEELDAEDDARSRQVYTACLDVIPHRQFTFAKIWLLFAKFELRQRHLQQARKILGTAIGKCPKDKLFRAYVDLEIDLREFDRCRVLYQKWLEFGPSNTTVWTRFAELEGVLGDDERARAIFELSVNQPRLDYPEVVWKAYIDFENDRQQYAQVRAIYERLLERTSHIKAWISFAKFELSVGSDDDGTKRVTPEAVETARKVFRRAHETLTDNKADKEERLLLLEEWSQFELQYGDGVSREAVRKEMPIRMKARRQLAADDGSEAGWEEYYDYVFPSDKTVTPAMRLLQLSKSFKQKRQLSEVEEDSVNEEDDDDCEKPDTTETAIDSTSINAQ